MWHSVKVRFDLLLDRACCGRFHRFDKWLLSVMSYCEENAHNGLVTALIGRPWHCGTALMATVSVIATSVPRRSLPRWFVWFDIKLFIVVSSTVSYREESAHNGLITALIGHPWHGDGPEVFICLCFGCCFMAKSIKFYTGMIHS